VFFAGDAAAIEWVSECRNTTCTLFAAMKLAISVRSVAYDHQASGFATVSGGPSTRRRRR
jgi:hypothetical protein